MISILGCIVIVIAVRVENGGIFHVRGGLLFRFLIFAERPTVVWFGLIAMLGIFISVISIIGYFVFSCPLFACYFEAIFSMRLLLEASHCSYLLAFIFCI